MSHGGIIAQKQQQANEFIRGLLFRLGENETLPSIRTLMSRSGFGRVIIESALHYWMSRKVLAVKPRLGYYRTAVENFAHNQQSISIIACSCVNYLNSDSFMNHLVQYLFEIGSKNNINMWVHAVSLEQPVSAYSDLVKEKSICNAFLICPENIEIVKSVQALGVNCVVMMPAYRLRVGPGVVDTPGMMDLQLDYLLQRGHRRIAYLYCDEEYYTQYSLAARREAYYRRMALEGIRILPEWVQPIWKSESEMRRNLDILLSPAIRPTAIICTDFYLPLIYGILAEKHLAIGHDIAVLSDGEDSRLVPAPTMVRNSCREISQLAWELMDNLRAGKTETRILSPVLRIQEGRSVFSVSVSPLR